MEGSERERGGLKERSRNWGGGLSGKTEIGKKRRRERKKRE